MTSRNFYESVMFIKQVLVAASRIKMKYVLDIKLLHISHVLEIPINNQRSQHIETCQLKGSTDHKTGFYMTQFVKSVQMRIFFWSVFSCIQSEYRETRTRKTPYLNTFQAATGILVLHGLI